MDEVRAFMNNPCPSTAQVTKLRGPLTGGFRITKEDHINDLNRREEHRHSVTIRGTDYAREVKQREADLYMKKRDEVEMERAYQQSIGGGLDSLEQLSSWGASIQNIGQLTDECMTEVYSKYSFQMKEDTNKLAINEFKQKILDCISAFPVVIIEGPTGCGKTTQVPQWILDNCYQNRRPCKIIVTQPRKIAAISISRRVAQERGWDVGGLVGYQIGLDNKTSADTRIHYVTTGVLLQKLVSAKTMNEYTHVILDEVHERGQEMDFLLLVVRKYLNTVSPGVKVILMSATFNRTAFTDYFDNMSASIKVEKKDPMFTVKTFYLNHLTKFGSILQNSKPKEEPSIAPEMYHLVVKLVSAFEHIDKQEDNFEDRSTADLPSVLIFLPGINEIEECFMCLNDEELRMKLSDAECSRYKWWVLPLHSTITADEQARVFLRAPPGHRKVILATNIAESSITVPDIKYVIDFCLMKVLVADDETNFTSLQLSWASKTNCEQRAGRAGRVRDGRVYRLVNEKFYDSLQQESKPEMLRCPLERLVLLAKMLDMGPPSDILGLAMDPPDMCNIHRTILVLKEMGALKKTLDEEWSPTDGDVTYLGRVMARLPLDVRASKLIVLGYIYGCLEETIIMAAAMSVKNLFSSPFRERLNAYNSKLTWADGSTSDANAFLNVYKVWYHLRQQQFFKHPGNNEAEWARRFYVQVRSLREMDDLVRELKMRLSREGIDVARQTSPWHKSELPLVLKVVTAGAVYPQYFVQVSQDEAREREAVRQLSGLDPRNTVYLKNFPDNQPGQIYAASIRNIVRRQIGDEPQVIFDKNSRKVFLTFREDNTSRRRGNNDPTIPGQVVLPVYKAVKARQLRMDVRVPLLPVEKAQELAKIMEEEEADASRNQFMPRLPDIDDTHIQIIITELITVSNFWVQYADESTQSDFNQIQGALNRRPLLAHTGPARVGDVFAAPRTEANRTDMWRARVTKVLPRDMLEVVYIDWGAVGRVNACNLHELPRGSLAAAAPALALRCRLAGVQPSPLLDVHAQWSPEAFALFRKLTARGPLFGKVYSVVQGVVVIELLPNGGNVNVNQELLKQHFAVPCEESYDSKLNHDLRESASELNSAQKNKFNEEQADLSIYQLREAQPPSARDCNMDVCLKGPYSPLETTAHSLMYASRDKQVTIEWNSVNSVLLDTEPQELYERLVVAAEVGQNEAQSKLTLRHTTLMPYVPGLPAIIALMFCPMAELRRDAAGTRYVSALCGLGSDEGGQPYFPEHDLLVNVDADLDLDDIGKINHVRYLMDYMIYCEEGQDTPTENEFTPEIVKNIRNDILDLFRKRRNHREPQAVVNAWEWRSVPEHELMEITTKEIMERCVIYPLHAPQELRKPPPDALRQLRDDTERLKQLVCSRSAISSTAELTCKLCGTAPMPPHAMRIHLYSNSHKKKEEVDFRSIES